MLKRPPSYSDSWLVVGNQQSELLTPILVPVSATSLSVNTDSTSPNPVPAPAPQRELRPSRSRGVLCFLFLFKGSFHILLISAFETLFYFLYVNKSENQGILNTINTYYQPLVQNCQQTWGNGTKWFVRQLLAYEIDQQQIDVNGNEARMSREAYNQLLLMWSSLYSVFCLVACLGASGFVWWKGWVIPWKRMLAENLMFVILLGLYELFFFRTIIYQYDTLSTAELNQYIVDGLAQCANH